jgi:hypothetical protein
MRSGKYEAKRHIGRIQVDPGSRSDNAYCQPSFHKTASDGGLRRGRQRISWYGTFEDIRPISERRDGAYCGEGVVHGGRKNITLISDSGESV